MKSKGVPGEHVEKLEGSRRLNLDQSTFLYSDQEIDGKAFLELTIDELNKILPDKLGIVKKIYRLVQAVSWMICVS